MFDVVTKYCEELEKSTIPFYSRCGRLIFGKNFAALTYEIAFDPIPFPEGENVFNSTPRLILELTEEQSEKVQKFMEKLRDNPQKD